MILVTGSSGVLGQALIRELAYQKASFAELNSSHGDLRDASVARALFEKFKPKTVIHAAARVHGLLGNTSFPAEMFLDNLLINTNVVEAARISGCERFVAVSTVAVYPAQVSFPVSEDSIWYGPPHQSEEFYAHAKRAMLAHLQSCNQQYGLKFSYAIMTNLYGPHDRFDTRYGHVIPSLVAKFHAASLEHGSVQIWGTGVAKRDFLYADDAARALLLLLTGESSSVFNVATGVTVPIRRVVEILAEISGVSEINWDATKPNGQLDRGYDISALRSLGFEPKISLKEGLSRTYRWYADNYRALRS